MRSIWITSTTINIISIRVIDAVVNIFPGVFCNCVLVYLYIVALVYIQCGCSSTGFLFALTTFYIPSTVYHTYPTLSTKIAKTTYFIHHSVNGNGISAAIGTLRRESKKKDYLHCRYRCPTLPFPMWNNSSLSF